MKAKLYFSLGFVFLYQFAFTQDSTSTNNQTSSAFKPTFFKLFGGAINATYDNKNTASSFDLSAQSFHYYLIVGKRKRIDTIHYKLKNVRSKYRGLDFYILNRASMDLNNSKSIANTYFTTLQPSPFTIRLSKELFFSKNRILSSENIAPVISLLLTGDGRLIPYNTRSEQTEVGASAHSYLSLSCKFKRLQFNSNGEMVDNGILYFKPSIGVGYGSNGIMGSVLNNPKDPFLVSSQCQLGFKSDKKSFQDFSFLVSYVLNNIKGPQLRAGVVVKGQ